MSTWVSLVQNGRSLVELIGLPSIRSMHESEYLRMSWVKRNQNPNCRMLDWLRSMRLSMRSRPLRLRLDGSVTLRTSINDLLDQVRARDKGVWGTHQLGMVLRSLVGAKLRLSLPERAISVYGASVVDSISHREADFLVGETAIHVTAFPQERLMERCRTNIERGLHPIIVTLRERIGIVEALAENLSILDRVEFFDVDHFISHSIQVQSGFARERLESTVVQLVAEYNSIIDGCNADPSLKIRM